tara:strand:- start:1134 stop:1685 length:552 start_codon:yes stop_codon:yes gene_type:complete
MANYNNILIWPNNSAINKISIPQFPSYLKVENGNVNNNELQSNDLIGANIAIGDVYIEDLQAPPTSTSMVGKVTNFDSATGLVTFGTNQNPVLGEGRFYRSNTGIKNPGTVHTEGYKFRPGTPGSSPSANPIDIIVRLPNTEFSALLDYTVEKYQDVRIQAILGSGGASSSYENFLILGEDGD